MMTNRQHDEAYLSTARNIETIAHELRRISNLMVIRFVMDEAVNEKKGLLDEEEIANLKEAFGKL